jgi:hypothetical protein
MSGEHREFVDGMIKELQERKILDKNGDEIKKKKKRIQKSDKIKAYARIGNGKLMPCTITVSTVKIPKKRTNK